LTGNGKHRHLPAKRAFRATQRGGSGWREMRQAVATSRFAQSEPAAARTINAGGRSPFVLVCDHASNRIPEYYQGLGLSAVDRLRHIAWDPGALAVSMAMVSLLDCPLIHSTVSRLVIDCNRTHGAPDLIPPMSEDTEIPGNRFVGDNERARRIAEFHDPFHGAIDAVLDARAARGETSILVAMHSFTPVYRGVARPWPIGLVHGLDTTFSRAVFDAMAAAEPALNIGWNEPYAALNGVTYTLEHHGDGRGLVSTMFEIRHDQILAPDGISRWASLIAQSLEAARRAVAAAG
jgi:predicted N-formylglutamate amidohydrolase